MSESGAPNADGFSIAEAAAMLAHAGIVDDASGEREASWRRLVSTTAFHTSCRVFADAFSKRFLDGLSKRVAIAKSVQTWRETNGISEEPNWGAMSELLSERLLRGLGQAQATTVSGATVKPVSVQVHYLQVVLKSVMGGAIEASKVIAFTNGLIDELRKKGALRRVTEGREWLRDMGEEGEAKGPPLLKPDARQPSPPPQVSPPAEAADGSGAAPDQVDTLGGVAPPSETEPAKPTGPLWRYMPLPDDPDKHTEYEKSTLEAPEAGKIIAARVRGKKHKHEGTNCDDGFAVGTVGPWSILAVADGGGSYKFSRVGSEAASTGAVEYLEEALAGISIERRTSKDDVGDTDEDVAAARAALKKGVRKGWAKLGVEYRRRAEKREYTRLLGRDMNLKDMYTTLLVAIHTRFETDEGPRSLVLSCAVGDGMVAAIGGTGEAHLLMRPDSGEFGGEVEFLGERLTEEESLKTRTFPLVGNVKALLLMTDGVADDYFPNAARMAELYADLVLNGVVVLKEPSGEEVLEDLKGTRCSAAEAVPVDDFLVEWERLLAEPEKVCLASAEKLAESLGVKGGELSVRPRLLAHLQRVARDRVMPGIEDPAERLLVWLDSYQVKGSFDDRALALYQEGNGA